MKIECLLKRPNGTIVDFGTKTYHFQPDAKGRHVAVVGDESHAARLLSITEGYRALDGEPQLPPAQTFASPSDAELEKARAQGAANVEHIAAARAESEAARAAAEAKGDESKKPAGDELENAKAAYIEKFGKKPHHTWSAETIRQKIAEG